MANIYYAFTGAHPHCRPSNSPLFLSLSPPDPSSEPNSACEWFPVGTEPHRISPFLGGDIKNPSYFITDALTESSFKRFPIAPAAWGACVVPNPRVVRWLCPGLHVISDKYELALLGGKLGKEYLIPSVAVDQFGRVTGRDEVEEATRRLGWNGAAWIAKLASAHRGHGISVHSSIDEAIAAIGRGTRGVVQPIVPRPLCVNVDGTDYKADLRIWVAVLFGRLPGADDGRRGRDIDDEDFNLFEEETRERSATPTDNHDSDSDMDGSISAESNPRTFLEIWLARDGLSRISGHPHDPSSDSNTHILRGEVTNFALQVNWLSESPQPSCAVPRVVPFTSTESWYHQIYPAIRTAITDLFNEIAPKLNKFESTGATLLGLDILPHHTSRGLEIKIIEANLLPSSWRSVEGARDVADSVLGSWKSLVERTVLLSEGLTSDAVEIGRWERLGKWLA